MPLPAPTSKICVACKTEKPISAFPKPPGDGQKYPSRCSACADKIRNQQQEARDRTQGFQVCTACGERKPLDAYASRGGVRSAELHRRCKTCMGTYSAAHYAASRERETQRAATNLARLQAEGTKKKCPRCQDTLALENFSRDTRSTDGLKRICKACDEHTMREYHARANVKSRETVRLRDQNLRAHYGVSSEIFDTISASQGHVCANPACRANRTDMETSKGFHLDHDHKTGKVRGMLCRSCNVTLGHAGDNEAVLLGLVTYLRDHAAHEADVPPPGATADAWEAFLGKKKGPV